MTRSGRWQKGMIVLGFAVLGWAYCGMLVGIGRQFLPMNEILVIHAVGAPLGFAAISYAYFRRFAFTGALATAMAFVGVVLFLDLFPVAPVFEKSFAMFRSLLGTWVPFVGIFAATYLAGVMTR